MPNARTASLARQLVSTNTAYFPNENAVYRIGRSALLVEEVELRRHIECVAAQRRTLPQGSEVSHDYEFVSETGPIPF